MGSLSHRRGYCIEIAFRSSEMNILDSKTGGKARTIILAIMTLTGEVLTIFDIGSLDLRSQIQRSFLALMTAIAILTYGSKIGDKNEK